MQFVDVIGSLRRHWQVSVAILLLSCIGLGVFLFTRNEVRAPDSWKATAQLLVPVRGPDGTLPPGVPASLLQGQAAVALGSTTTREAIRQAGLNAAQAQEVAFGVEQQASDPQNGVRGDIMTLSVTAPDVNQAIRLAGTYADAYISARQRSVASGDQAGQRGARHALEVLDNRLADVDRQIDDANPFILSELNRTSTATTSSGDNSGDATAQPAITLPANTPLDTVLLAYEHRSLVQRINGTRQTYADSSIRSLIPQGYASIVERPLPTQITPELPSPLIPIAIALGLGLVLAIAVPVLIDYLDKTIRDPRTAASTLAAPVLSTIPASSAANLVALAKPGSPRDGAYRALAATSVATDQLPRAIVVTAPVGQMQDSVAANFAAALAGLGLRVALVATDPRQAWFIESTGTQDAPTLPDLLDLARAGRLNGQIRDSLVPTHLHNLAVLAPGTTGAEALLEGLPALLEALAVADIDVTVIAGPALLDDPSATILAWSTRSVLWVVEAGEVTEQEAHEAASRLERAGAVPFGVAMVASKD